MAIAQEMEAGRLGTAAKGQGAAALERSARGITALTQLMEQDAPAGAA